MSTPPQPLPREMAVASVCATVLTVALTYPQLLHLASHVGSHYDAFFSIWRLAWIAHQLLADPAHLFDANIFYPSTNTLALSDAILLLGVLSAPALWAGANPVVVYNVLVLLSFVTAALAMYFFVRSIGIPKLAAAIAGAAFAFNSYRFAHYPQLELLWTCWIPLALWSFHRALATRRARDGVLLGLFVACQALTCLYYAVFLVTGLIILGCVAAFQMPPRDRLKMWKPAAAALVVCGVTVAPYALPYMKSRQTVGDRTIQEVHNWSPPLGSYLGAQEGNWLYDRAGTSFDPVEKALFPGVTVAALAVVGLISGPRRYVILYGILCLVTFDLSLGTYGVTYRYLFDLVSIYRGLRVPGRMFIIVSAALSVLAAMGATRLATAGRFGWSAALAMLGFAVVESVSIPLPLLAVPPATPKVQALLATEPRVIVVEWPWPRADALGDTRAPVYMYRSIFHWQHLVNGYSGNYPARYIGFLEAIRDFPATDALRHMQGLGVGYVIVHSEPDPSRYVDVLRRIANQPALELLLVENLGGEEITLYRLHRAPPQ